MFRHVVLGLLHSGRPQHGYALMREYRERVGTQVSTGNFYLELQRLVADGLVAIAKRRDEDDVRRAPYEITAQGRTTFRDWFVETTHLDLTRGPEDEFAYRIAFLSDVDPADARMVLDHAQEQLWARAKTLERTRTSLLRSGGPADGLPVLPLTIGRQIRRVAAEIAFLDDLRAIYEAWLGTRQPASRTKTARAKRSNGGTREVPSGAK